MTNGIKTTQFVGWVSVPDPHTPHLAYLLQRSPHLKARLVTYNGENHLFLPCLDTQGLLAEGLAKSDPKDYNTRAAIIIFAGGQMRLGQAECTRCSWKAEEEEKSGRSVAPSPFLACATAGTTMDGVCSGYILDGGSRLEMIFRCSVALTSVTPERNYGLKTSIRQSLHESALVIGDEPDYELCIRKLFHFTTSDNPEPLITVQVDTTSRNGTSNSTGMDGDGITETGYPSGTLKPRTKKPRVRTR